MRIVDKTDMYKEYKKLKFKNTIYEINDNLMLANCEGSNFDYIGKLLKIIRVEGQPQVITLIQV